MKLVQIYTDGACSGNPGPGGWAAILIYEQNIKKISGYIDNTTNNRMELFSIIKGIACLTQTCTIEIYSDSAYVVDAFNKNWIKKWQNNNWKTADGKDCKNVDLWKDLIARLKTHEYSFIKVKGHADNIYNNECDKLARDEINKNR